jgi:hypothetical protein
MDGLKKNLNRMMNRENNRGVAYFEGYSPIEMHHIIYDPFSENCPVQLMELSKEDYSKIPIFNQIKYLLKLIDEAGELKVTQRDYLPPKIVSDIYAQGFIKDYGIESGISKSFREADIPSINLTKILAILTGCIKKRSKKLSLTKKGKSQLDNDYELLKNIFLTFGTKFNWAYYDLYGENEIGQLGFGFSLILLGKYGDVEREDAFYAEKYFAAFPDLIEEVEPPYYQPIDDMAKNCYSVRTFDRFLDYFGLVNIKPEDRWNPEKLIAKTELFDKFIKILPHKDIHKIPR